MKSLFTFLILLAAAPLYAQKEPETQLAAPPKICGIYFDYDAVGNRVKRSYDCRNPDDTYEPPKEASRPNTTGATDPRHTPPLVQNPAAFQSLTDKAPVLFPNPTSGPFTLQLPAIPEIPLHFHWYNQEMQILGSGTIATQAYKGDISAWPDGIYILRVYHGNDTYIFRIVKATAAAH